MSAAKTLSIVAVALSVCVTMTNAQETPPEKITKVMTIAHTDAERLAKVLEYIEPGLRVAATDSQTLVLQGPEATVNRVVRDVVGPMDSPQTQLMTDAAPVFVPLPSISSEDFPSMALAMLDPELRSSIAIDTASRLLVIRGSEAEVDAIRELVSQLSQPKRPIGIHCYFLRGRMGSGTSSPAAALPDDLKPIAATLAKSGLGGAALLAPVIVSTNDGEYFSTHSSLKVTDDTGGAEYLSFDIEGRASLDAGNVVQLELEGMVSGTYGRDKRTNYKINTTVSTKMGSYVVLAAAPSTTLVGDYIALVARVVTAE